MNIILNGDSHEVGNNISLDELIASLGLSPESVVTELNGEIISCDNRACVIKENDRLEILRFVGGG